MSYACGSSIDEISRGLAAFRPYDKRARVEQLDSGIRILNDCYNANPASMRAALETLVDLKKDHRSIAVLGDMLELGDKSDSAHATLGKTIKELGLDFLATFGSQAENVVASAKSIGMDESAAQGFANKKDLVSWLNKLIQDGNIGPGDWILVKGSRGMRMEEVIELLHNHNFRIRAEGN
jgi:UDP-N-acetylmuramyl pentapeptide synthase